MGCGNCGTDKCSCGPSDCGSGCGCGSSGSCGCGNQGSCCETEMPNNEQMFEMFLGLAEAAWYKALKERMVEYYAKKHGKELDQMAEFFCHAAGMKWMSYEEFQKKKPELLKQYMEEMEKAKKK